MKIPKAILPLAIFALLLCAPLPSKTASAPAQTCGQCEQVCQQAASTVLLYCAVFGGSEDECAMAALCAKYRCGGENCSHCSWAQNSVAIEMCGMTRQ